MKTEKKFCMAANLHAVGDLRYEQLPIPPLAEDELLVKIKACGVCGSDVGRVFAKGTYHFPTVIGHEFAGVVEQDPEGKLDGMRVVVFPILPCFSCESCAVGSYPTCKSYDYYGSRRDGGMSEYLPVKRWNLLPLPDGISYEEGAMCEPISVGRHAIGKLELKKGERLLISGAGPIGLIAGQWARKAGVGEVCYFDIDERKLAFAKSLGFSEYTEGMTVDAVLEGTGAPDAVARCLAAVRAFGRVVLMGNPAGDVPLSQNTYWHVLRKELRLMGTWNSSYNDVDNDWRESLAALADGSLDVKPLITHTYPLSRVNEAFAMMKERREFYNKVLLIMNEEEN